MASALPLEPTHPGEPSMRAKVVAMLLILLEFVPILAHSAAISPKLTQLPADRNEIQALLDTYTKAVSSKNQKLFESLLLNRNIQFSHATSAVKKAARDNGTHNYDEFRKSVFQGRPFTQRFQDVHITQDGELAQVSLVFVNTSASEVSWGWKTLQLLKIDGRWRIASEFYTTH
jgi:hypothetical protein